MIISDRKLYERRIREGSVEAVASLQHLADLVNATQADIHYLHFQSAGVNFTEAHELLGGIYNDLADAYDSLVELVLQHGGKITHPNNSAPAVGFVNTSEPGLFDAHRAYGRLYGLLQAVVSEATAVRAQFDGLDDADSVAICNYLEQFIQDWSKEASYKTARRSM
jgi:DNA-binding ferritin-like protein